MAGESLTISNCREPVAVGAFLTGSHAYGTPLPGSDIDLAVLVSPSDLDALCGQQDLRESEGADGCYDGETRSVSLRFGRLNLLAFANQKDFRAWAVANEALKIQRPVTRERAVATIKLALATARAT